MPQALFIIVIACSGLVMLAACLQVRPWLYPETLAVDPQPADSRFQRVSFAAEARRIAAVNPQIRPDVFEGAGHSDLYELQPDPYRQTALNYLQRL